MWNLWASLARAHNTALLLTLSLPPGNGGGVGKGQQEREKRWLGGRSWEANSSGEGSWGV